MPDWDDIWDRSPNEPITDDGLAYLRKQVADRMADVAVGPLIARIDAVEAQSKRLRDAFEVLLVESSLIEHDGNPLARFIWEVGAAVLDEIQNKPST